MSVRPSLAQLRRFVGRPDVFAEQANDGTWRPRHEDLTDKWLSQHLEGTSTLGTYTNVGDQARFLVFDVDDGDEKTVNRVAQALQKYPVPPRSTGVEDSGRKGFHVWVLLQDFVPAADLRRLGRAVSALAKFEGEVFPKQDEARDLGSLVKLPGGVHRVTGRRCDFVDGVPVPMPLKTWDRVVALLPEEVRGHRAAEPVDVFPCITRAQEGVPEGQRNQALFQLACYLRRCGLTEDNLATVVHGAAALCDPPVEAPETDTVIESSQHSGVICGQLPEGLHCPEGRCMLDRHGGLYVRRGQLRGAARGEAVVLKVAEDSGVGVVRLEHPDLVGVAKGRVK